MDSEQDRTLYCGQLNEEVTEELLYELFLQAGPIDRINIPKDQQNEKKHRGFGFITYKHAVSVNYAINLLCEERLFGRKLKLNSKGGSQPADRPTDKANSYYRSYSVPENLNQQPREFNNMMPPQNGYQNFPPQFNGYQNQNQNQFQQLPFMGIPFGNLPMPFPNQFIPGQKRPYENETYVNGKRICIQNEVQAERPFGRHPGETYDRGPFSKDMDNRSRDSRFNDSRRGDNDSRHNDRRGSDNYHDSRSGRYQDSGSSSNSRSRHSHNDRYSNRR